MLEPAGGSRTPSVLSDRVPHHSSGLAVPKRDSRATEHQPGNGPGRGVSALTVLPGGGSAHPRDNRAALGLSPKPRGRGSALTPQDSTVGPAHHASVLPSPTMQDGISDFQTPELAK